MTVDAARLRISLRYIDPMPVREIEIPLSMTFQGLYDTIQAAFLWYNCHLWEFNYAGKAYGIPFEDEFYETNVYNAKTVRLTKLRDNKAPKEFTYVYDMGDNWDTTLRF